MAATMDQILETLQEFRKETYQKFDQIDQRFDKIEGRMDQVERNMEIMKKYYFQDRTMMMQLIHEVKDQQKEDRTITMQLIQEVRDQQKEDHKMILDIWASRDKVTINFNRKLYIATASISVVVSTVISTGISLAIQGL
jgi:hypothetical protein